MSYEKIAEKLQNDLQQELGFTFSIGLASTKVLAKVGSKWKKPHGFTPIPNNEIPKYLAKLPVGNVWGIGGQTTALLQGFGIYTALHFIRKDEVWVKKYLSKPYQEIWSELSGKSVIPLQNEPRSTHYSIQKMKTFTPPSADPLFIFSAILSPPIILLPDPRINLPKK